MKKSIAILAALGLAACVDDVTVDGQQAFLADCAACHGTDAMGSGSFGAQLITPPPDLTTLSQRYGGVFPRTYVLSTIDGLNRDKHFSGAMPEFGAGDMGPIVMTEEDGNPVPIPARLLAITDYLQSLQR